MIPSRQNGYIEKTRKGEYVPDNLTLELELFCKDGSTVWTELIISVIHESSNKLAGIVGVTRDISQRIKVEEALRIANRQLSLLSGITRHDILNMISVIYASLMCMEMDCKDPAMIHYLKIMESTTKDIQGKIEFTRVYEELGTHVPQWLNLDGIMSQMRVPDGVTLIKNLQNYEIYADPMFSKVFSNLLDNSMRHGERVTDIHVSCVEAGKVLFIVWEDNGIGIPEDEKEKIFDRDFGKNTGLGMFLVREILALTGLSIRESGVSGRGARFEIVVPFSMFRKNIRSGDDS